MESSPPGSEVFLLRPVGRSPVQLPVSGYTPKILQLELGSQGTSELTGSRTLRGTHHLVYRLLPYWGILIY